MAAVALVLGALGVFALCSLASCVRELVSAIRALAGITAHGVEIQKRSAAVSERMAGVVARTEEAAVARMLGTETSGSKH